MLDELCKDMILCIIHYLSVKDVRNIRLVCKQLYTYITDGGVLSYQTFLRNSLNEKRSIIVCPYFNGFESILTNYINQRPTFILSYLPKGMAIPFRFNCHNYSIEFNMWRQIDQKNTDCIQLIVFCKKVSDIDILHLLRTCDKCVIFSQSKNFDNFSDFVMNELPFLMPTHTLTKFVFKHYIGDSRSTIKLIRRIKPRFTFTSGVYYTYTNNNSNDVVIWSSSSGSTYPLDIIDIVKIFRYVCEQDTKITFHIVSSRCTQFINRLIVNVLLGKIDLCGVSLEHVVSYFLTYYQRHKKMTNQLSNFDWNKFKEDYQNEYINHVQYHEKYEYKL